MEAGNDAIVYEEFEPFCKWQRTQDHDIIEIHLQDFKKEQLKVQITSHGALGIYGERALDASKHTKFYKEIPVPANSYYTRVIRAKFVNENLVITLPKLKPSLPQTNDQHVSSSEPVKGDHEGPQLPDVSGGGAKEPVSTESRFQAWKRKMMALRLAKMEASVAATTVSVAIIIAVAYMVHVYKSSVGDIDE